MFRTLALARRHLLPSARTSFDAGPRITWYPGHMVKAQRNMLEAVDRCDVVIEVRDARLPLSSANPILEQFGASKGRLIVFNKSDLADARQRKAIKAAVAAQLSAAGLKGEVLFTRGTNSKSGNKVLTAGLRLAGTPRFKTVGSMMMIMGVPNVGKSTLINAIRHQRRRPGSRKKGKVAPTGMKPGVTRGLRTFVVSGAPLVHLIDTPGVMVPRIEDEEAGLKLALTMAIPEGIVEYAVLADYALYALNRRGCFDYVDAFQLEGGPSNDIFEVLRGVHAHGAAQAGKGHLPLPRGLQTQQDKDYLQDTNYQNAARVFALAFRAGTLGHVVLDDIPGLEP